MKQILLVGVAVAGVVGGLLYLIWLTASQLYKDWRLGREFDEIQAATAELRRRKREQAATRLDNGCSHDFDQNMGEFPPSVCARCGIEKVKPPGACDHQWRRQEGNTPGSYCAKCGKQYRGSSVSGELV